MKIIRIFMTVLLVINLIGCGSIQKDYVTSDLTVKKEINSIPFAEKPLCNDQNEKESEEKKDEESDEPDTIEIVMVGDMLLHTRVEESAMREDGSYDYSSVFMHTKSLIEPADLSIVNEEVIIGGTGLGVSGYPAFNAPFEFADALADCGFDVICHATNHALDKGKKGLLNCLSNWEEKHPEIEVLGIHDSKEDSEEIYIYKKNEIKVAVLNYTYGTNGISLPSDMPYAVDLMNEKKISDDIKKAENKADFTIVCPHWGTEYRLTPDSYQKKWAKLFVNNGADLIIGTHPHVPEPVEWVEDEETGNKALVYYSLGNYVNWTSGTGSGVSNRMLGLMAKVRLKKDKDGKVIIKDSDTIPLVCHVESGEGRVTVYPLSEYTNELSNNNEIVKQDSSFSYDYLKKLANDVLKIQSKDTEP